MNADFPPSLAAELLDDFYAECDELLSGMRLLLTRLDQAVAMAHVDVESLEGLYRNVHSFKGISAMVGLRPAEELAHAAEGLLRRLGRTETAVDHGVLELISSVVQRLEQTVATHRLRQPMPDNTDLLGKLREPAGAASGPPPEASNEPRPAQPPPSTLPPTANWRATFSPSAELDRRGININSVRQRMTAMGSILSAAPAIEPGGAMRFEFALMLAQPPDNPGAWAEDGIQFHAIEAPAAAPAHRVGTPKAADASPSRLFVAPSHIVRVELTRLDELMRIAGEMVIHRSRLEAVIQATSGDRSALNEVNLWLGRSLRELRAAITRVRLVPIAEIFTRMPFAVRDLAQDTGKKVRLVIEGQDTEIDKYLVERLKEPLLHLVRNAISHGVELPERRKEAGKPEEATLVLRAATDGQSVLIAIRDDGEGIDAEKIARRAAALGIPLAANPSEADLLEVLCRPGFSTRTEADYAAGRGVGMAVVQTTVRELGGILTLHTAPGQWTQFSLRLPLTLSLAEAFIVSAAGQTCAIPQAFVREIILIAEKDVRPIRHVEVVSYRDGVLPLVRLRQMFGADASTAAQVPVLVISSERGTAGLVIDRVHGQREVVVRSLQDPLLQVPGISGATELGDGRPVLILDGVALTSGAVRPRRAESAADAPVLQPA